MNILKTFLVVIGVTAIVWAVSSCTSFGVRTPAGFTAGSAKPLVLIGQIPGEYLGKDKNSTFLGYLEISKRVIQKMGLITEAQVAAFVASEKQAKTVIVLKTGGSSAYDVIYPGLLNLHNHTKQNVLPTWGAAKGQFQNRFEWRDWGVYKKSVSQNMNPWIGFGKPVECAAFRWSNLQNMINGTVFLQGPSSCIADFGIHKVEDSSSYVSQKAAVQAPTDLIYPNEMTYVWQVLGPKIKAGKTYEQALAEDVVEHCPSLKGVITADTVNKGGLKILKDKAKLTAACTAGTLHDKFIRYVYFIHPSIAGKKESLSDPRRSAIIAHLSEGRRQDAYNMLEYPLLKMIGLNKPFVNFIHGVGVTPADLQDMGKNKMGLVWSPYSNLLLYGQTLDIVVAQKAGVILAIGSDWVPTGSKSVLEEIKLAYRYVERERINNIFTDEVLYKMMTENPAKMINHWDNAPGEAGVGRLAVGSMGSVIAVSQLDKNPYANLVRKATEKEINLVIVDGLPSYGNTDYLDQAGVTQYEVFSNEIIEADRAALAGGLPKPVVKPETAEVEDDHGESVASVKIDPFLAQFAIAAKKIQFNKKDNCQFKVAKAFVTPNTKSVEAVVDAFEKQTQLNLDKIDDIRQLLAAATMTSSINRLAPKGDDANYATPYFPSLYTCNDARHLNRITNYIRSDGNDELKQNLVNRAALRAVKGMPKSAENLAKSYGQAYEVK
jgi:hypothetical protein